MVESWCPRGTYLAAHGGGAVEPEEGFIQQAFLEVCPETRLPCKVKYRFRTFQDPADYVVQRWCCPIE